MNQGRSPSPEEKLLRLLRKKPKDALPEQSAPSTQETMVISGWSKRSPLGNTAAFRGVFFGPGLKRLNILFWICLGAELFYLLGSLVWSFVAGEDKKKPFLQESKPEVSVTSLRLLPLTSRL